jgi:tRNA threonylcarbamoyladenosine modification (KEOPS) complex Cgi121 subunit
MMKFFQVKGWIDVGKLGPVIMQGLPPYPLWGIRLPLDSGVRKSLVSQFIEKRADESWLLIGKETLCSDEQIWIAWLGLQRRKMQDCMRSNSIDGEMLRLLSGTHHVSAGIKRAGVSESDAEAWIVKIPESEGEGMIPVCELLQIRETAVELAAEISAEITDSRPTPTIEGLIRLQIISPEEISEIDNGDIGRWSNEEICDLMIASIATSDLQG